MRRHGHVTGLFVAGLAGFVCTVALGAPPAAPDVWAKAPPMPTTCYLEDNSIEKLTAAKEAVQADIDRQNTINDEVKGKLKDIDPMEQASRMQQYMMDHPEEATKLMQANANMGSTFSNAEVQSDETRKTMETELDTQLTQYQATLDKALVPIEAKFKDLDVRAQKDLVASGETWVYAPWAVKEFNTLTAEANRIYETTCATWWGAAGPFHVWMKRYKEHVINQIPRREDADKLSAGMMVPVTGTADKTYKSTASLSAVVDYLDHGIKLFGHLNRYPRRRME